MAAKSVILLLPTSVKIQWVQCILHSFECLCISIYTSYICIYIYIYTIDIMYICYEMLRKKQVENANFKMPILKYQF